MTAMFMRNAHKILGRNFSTNICNSITKKWSDCRSIINPEITKNYHKRHYNWENKGKTTMLSFALGISFFGLFGSEKKKEPEVIMTIKRSILLMQKEEFEKAEQMLHVALKQAQDLQNSDAVTYIYDLMANVAFITEDYKKAETLFANVMQRLLSQGVSENDLRIIHMSLKIAKMYEQQENFEKATVGYEYCIKHLQEAIDAKTEDTDILTFYGMTMDWYARMLVTMSKYKEAYEYFLKAYDVSVKVNGEEHAETIILLNDLGTLNCLQGKHDEAINHLEKAIQLASKIEDDENLSVLHINLGNTYIRKQLFEEAKKWCKQGWRIAKNTNDTESLKEAQLCLDEVNKVLP